MIIGDLTRWVVNKPNKTKKEKQKMEVLAIVALVVGVGYGVDHDFKVAKGYKSYKECRAENPKHHNTMTSWKYDPCNPVAYLKHNSK